MCSSDLIENALTYIHNFDPDKSKNPFAYFTQIIYYAFLRRIQKEKKQQYIKFKTIQNGALMNELVTMSPEDQRHFQQTINKDSEERMNDLVQKFEDKENAGKKPKKPRKKKDVGLEKYLGHDHHKM